MYDVIIMENQEKENEKMPIKDAGRIHFIIDNFNGKDRLFIKLKRIYKYELDELSSVSTKLDLPDNGLDSNNTIKIIIDTFKTNYEKKKKNNNITINFNKNEKNNKDKDIDKGIIYYFRNENDKKIKIFSKCDKDDKYWDSIDENYHTNIELVSSENEGIKEKIKVIKEQIKVDSINCKKDLKPLLVIKKSSNKSKPIALYLGEDPLKIFSEDPVKNPSENPKKEIKGGNRVDIFKLLELFAIDNGIIFDKPKDTSNIKTKIKPNVKPNVKEEFKFNPLKEDSLKTKENHLLMEETDFNNTIKKLTDLKQSIEDIKKRITKIIFVENLRGECFPETKTNQVKTKDDKCLNFENMETYELTKEIIDNFKDNTNKGKNEIKMFKEKIEKQITNFRKEKYEYFKKEKNKENSKPNYMTKIDEFKSKTYFELFGREYINNENNKGIKVNDEYRKEKYLDEIYKDIKSDIKIEEYVSEGMEKIGINKIVKEQIKKINSEIFGVIKNDEKDLTIKNDEKDLTIKNNEKDLTIKNLTNSKEETEEKNKEKSQYIDLTEIIISSIKEPVQQQVTRPKFLSLLSDVYKDNTKKIELIELLKQPQISKTVEEGIANPSPPPQPIVSQLSPQEKSKSKFLKLLVEASDELRKEQKSEEINFFDIFNDYFSIEKEEDITICPGKRYIAYLSVLDVNDIDIDIIENEDTDENKNKWEKLKDVLEEKIEDREVSTNPDSEKTPQRVYQPATPRDNGISCPPTARGE